MEGGRLSSHTEAAESFANSFRASALAEGSDADAVYHADESDFFYETIPSKSLVSHRKRAASGCTSSKKRVSVMVCAKATRTNRLPLLLMGKATKPRCSGRAKPPSIYKVQKRAWITIEISMEWYDEILIPSVTDFQRSIGKRKKFVFIIDNAPNPGIGRNRIRFSQLQSKIHSMQKMPLKASEPCRDSKEEFRGVARMPCSAYTRF